MYKLFILILIGCQLSIAQDCDLIVKGQILDKVSKEPIPNVVVKIKNTEKYTISDINGNFAIENICNRENTLNISCFGYCSSVCKFDEEHGETPHFYLTEEVSQLEDVYLEVTKQQRSNLESYTKETLKATEIEEKNTYSLGGLISEINGVSVSSTGTNIDIPIIHGLYGNRVSIYNNGVKHNFQNWGTEHAPEINISNAKSISIIKGAAGVKYGPESMGGVVLVQPNHLHLNEPFTANFNSSYETNGKGATSSIELEKGFNNIGLYANYKYQKIGDRNTPNYILTNSGKQENGFEGGLRLHYDKIDFKAYYSYLEQNLGVLKSAYTESLSSLENAINSNRPSIIEPFSYNIEEPNQLLNHQLIKTETNWIINPQNKIQVITAHQKNNRKEFDVRRNSHLPIIDLTLTSSEITTELHNKSNNNFENTFGVNIFNQDNVNNPGTNTTPFIPNYNNQRYSGYFISTKKINKTTLEAGLRFDKNTYLVKGRELNQNKFKDEFELQNLSWNIGLKHKISKESNIKTNIGLAWRAPNMAELYSYGQHGFQNSYGLLRYYFKDNKLKTDKITKFIDLDYKNEKGYKWTVDYSKNNKNYIFNFSPYFQYIENFIFDKPIGATGTFRGPVPAYIFAQTDMIAAGFDFQLQNTLNTNLKGTFNFSYLYSKDILNKSELINQPPLNTNYILNWNKNNLWNLDNLSLSLIPSYTFKQFNAPKVISIDDFNNGELNIDANSETFDFKEAPSGYFLLDSNITLKIKNVKAIINISNLLNKSYRSYLNKMRYFADEQGRNIRFSIIYNFLNNKNRNHKHYKQIYENN